jgi:hypothetical protein
MKKNFLRGLARPAGTDPHDLRSGQITGRRFQSKTEPGRRLAKAAKFQP